MYWIDANIGMVHTRFMQIRYLGDVGDAVGELGEAGYLVGVHEPGDDGDGEVDVLDGDGEIDVLDGNGEIDVLDGDAHEGARAVEVVAHGGQVHAALGRRRLWGDADGGRGRVRVNQTRWSRPCGRPPNQRRRHGHEQWNGV